MTRCPALKIAIRTQRQLKSSVSNERQKDHHVQRPRKVKKYMAEVSEGNMMPAGRQTESTKTFGNIYTLKTFKDTYLLLPNVDHCQDIDVYLFV